MGFCFRSLWTPASPPRRMRFITPTRADPEPDTPRTEPGEGLCLLLEDAVCSSTFFVLEPTSLQARWGFRLKTLLLQPLWPLNRRSNRRTRTWWHHPRTFHPAPLVVRTVRWTPPDTPWLRACTRHPLFSGIYLRSDLQARALLHAWNLPLHRPVLVIRFQSSGLYEERLVQDWKILRQTLLHLPESVLEALNDPVQRKPFLLDRMAQVLESLRQAHLPVPAFLAILWPFGPECSAVHDDMVKGIPVRIGHETRWPDVETPGFPPPDPRMALAWSLPARWAPWRNLFRRTTLLLGLFALGAGPAALIRDHHRLKTLQAEAIRHHRAIDQILETRQDLLDNTGVQAGSREATLCALRQTALTLEMCAGLEVLRQDLADLVRISLQNLPAGEWTLDIRETDAGASVVFSGQSSGPWPASWIRAVQDRWPGMAPEDKGPGAPGVPPPSSDLLAPPDLSTSVQFCLPAPLRKP
jgi:hypothetical protein